MSTVDKALLSSSYLVDFKIGKCKKHYNIGENVIKPCLISVCTEVLGPTTIA